MGSVRSERGDGQRSAIVMGGGLAGLSSSISLARRGLKVTLVEKQKTLGGRASSTAGPVGEQKIDTGLHVLCRHYLNLLAAMAEAEAADRRIVWFHETSYLDSGSRIRMNALDHLPSPLHLARYMLEPSYRLSNRMKGGLAGVRVALSTEDELAREDQRTYEEWNNANGLGREMLAFGNAGCDASTFLTADKVSAKPVLSWMRLLLRDSTASDMGVLETTLEEGIILPLARLAQDHGVEIITDISVEALYRAGSKVSEVGVKSGDRKKRLHADYYVSALPVNSFQCLIDEALGASSDYFRQILKIETIDTVSVVIWFDRVIPGLRRGPVLAESGIIRDFIDLAQIADHPTSVGSHQRSVVQFLLSGDTADAHGDVDDSLIGAVRRHFDELWPSARGAKVQSAVVSKIPNAMYAAYPGVERLRPSQVTPIENLFLAGDWTKHELNACMEGAFVSGLLAANAILLREGMAPVELKRVEDDPWLRAMKKITHLAAMKKGRASSSSAQLISVGADVQEKRGVVDQGARTR